MKSYKVAVVGATGLVGRTILKVLEERNFPVSELYPLATAKSAGQKLTCQGKEWTVAELTEDSFTEDMDIALFSAGGGTSAKFAPLAADKGILVVDNSSQWRMTEGIPLIVPEVNPEDFRMPGIIANPNCSTIQCMAPLKLLDQRYGLKRVVFTTFQAAAGAGVKGLNDLENGTTTTFDVPLVKNVIPRIDTFQDNGYTREEMKMVNETRKILHHPDLAITATCVRVPVDYGHSIAINAELEQDFDLDDLRGAMAQLPGVIVKDDPANLVYPTPLDCKGRDEIFLGRFRRDFSQANTVNFLSVADNVRKGAATNTIQIAELALQA